LVVDDPDYRRAVNTLLGDALDDLVAERFDGYTPFLHNYLCKFPGDGSDLYLHRDWMYVDERQGHHTYVCWVALEDITGHNGQLRVLRGSHHLDPMLRGTDLVAPWLSHTATIEDRLLSVPLRAGECIVFDNRLVHASFTNYTDRPRVAAAVGMRPDDADLVHFRRLDDASAARYDVDDDFFCTATPQGLLAAAPDLPVAEVVAVGGRDYTAEELAEAVDQGLLAHMDRVRHGVSSARSRAVGAAAAGRGWLTERVTGDVVRTRTHAARTALRTRSESVAAKLPTKEQVVERWKNLPSTAAVGVLAVNEATINRFGPETPAIWDPQQFDWARVIEAGFPEVRAEVEALLAGPKEIPHIEDVTGGIPQGNIGPWRSFVLMHQGRWIDWNCERCPRTTELVKQVPGLTMAGFSVLEPGTHITEHRGPNKGALRYQLGVIVPGEPGDCRIRVGDEMIVWADGEGCMFDFTVPHEAWNDSDGIRVLLMLEVVTPLPWYLDRPNRLAQHAMGWFPTTRDITNRLRALEPKLTKAG
ncbi:MAG: aspartyl/asparaginyl beta-hydroxylase domain-containing protein, partial [Actinomycetes bacterium]